MSRFAGASVASGLLLAAASPVLGQSLHAWLAMVPLAWAIDGERPRTAFALGWLAGVAFFLVEFVWVPGTIVRATSVEWLVAILPLPLLAAVLAVQFGLFAAALRFWQSRTGRSGIVAAALFWTSFEWVRSSWPLPCPWGLLGYALHDELRLLQIVDVTGIFGVSALIVAVNQAIYSALVRRDRRSVAALGAVTAVVLAAFTYGGMRLAELQSRAVTSTLLIGMIQPAIDPNQKWDPGAREAVIAISEQLSRDAVVQGASLVVWPEASAPYVFADDELYDLDPALFAVHREYRDRIVRFAGELRVPLLFGSAVAVPSPAGRGEVWNSVNRALLLHPNGRVVATYDKTILVPFGEYVPWHLSAVVDKLVPGVGNFLPGNGPTLFNASGVGFADLICYEAIFPDYTRRSVEAGAQFLVNQTNDAWFGASSAPIQHLAHAKVRAVENHVPMVRVANTGISSLIEPDGRIAESIELGERGFRVVDVRVSAPAPTFYTVHGDVFAQGAVLAALALLLYAGWSTAEPAAVAVAPV